MNVTQCSVAAITSNGGKIVRNSDGTVSAFVFNGVNSPLIPYVITQTCCNTLGYTYNTTTQKCNWSTTTSKGACPPTNVFNLVLNPDGNDGAIFTDEIDETCTLSIDFDYLFKFDCDTLSRLSKLAYSKECDSISSVFEHLGASAGIDIIDTSTGNAIIQTVYDETFLSPIGTGNLYQYLTAHTDNTGFYICGNLLKNTSDPNCYALNLYDLTINNDTLNCATVQNEIITQLLAEANLPSNSPVLKDKVSANAFASNWLHFHTEITDQNIINIIANKKIKLGIKLSGSCVDSCVLLDNIRLDKNCTKVTRKDIFVTKSPGFQLDRIRDNKKSWIANTETTHRTFNIAKSDGTQPIRYTDYYLDDERLVINTKEIDLDINIAAAIETDVWCYVSDNPCLLTGETIGTTFCTKYVGYYETSSYVQTAVTSTTVVVTGYCTTAGTTTTKYTCPPGFTATPSNDACKRVEQYSAQFLGNGPTIVKGDGFSGYSTSVRFYPSIDNNGALPVLYPYGAGSTLKDQTGGTITPLVINTTNTYWVTNGTSSTTVGKLNNAGISADTAQWLGFSECINIAQAGTYYVGLGADDYCRFKINGKLIVSLTGNSGSAPCYAPNGAPHEVWSVFPVYLNSGINLIEMEGLNWPQFANSGCPGAGGGTNYSAFAAEIYKPTSFAALTAATNDTQAGVIFSTRNKIGSFFDLSSPYSGGATTIGYTCAFGSGYALNKCNTPPVCTKITTSGITVDPAHSITGYCNEVRAITSDTVVYTYQAGVYSCPVGFSATPFNDICEKVTTSAATFNGNNGAPITRGSTNQAYGAYGTRFFPSIQNNSGLPYVYSGSSNILTNQTGAALTPIKTVNSGTFWFNPGSNRLVDGRLNKVGIADDTTQWLGFSQCINITVPGTYYIGLAADNYCQFSVDSTLVVALTGNSNNTPIAFPIDTNTTANQTNFTYWNVFEWNFTSGQHNITMLGLNQFGPASFGAEVYNPASFAALTAATTEAQTGLIFSTLQQVGSTYTVGTTIGWSCAGAGFSLSDCNPLAAPVCNKYEKSAITFTLATIPATATTTGYCRDQALTCVTPTITSKTQTDTGYTFTTITAETKVCLPKIYCCSDYCGDANIDLTRLMTEPLSNIQTIEDFEYYITSELIDVKDRKTLSSYPTLRLLYERYMNSQAFCGTKSSKFDYHTMNDFANLIGNYWVDLIEQVIPATTIWGSTRIYTNTIFDRQKFNYKGYSLFFGENKNHNVKVLSPATGDSCSVDVITRFIEGSSTGTTLFFNEGDLHEYNNVYVLQMNSGSEFVSLIKSIGPKSPCENGNGVINECLLLANITNNIAKDGTITANPVGSIGNVTYLWSPTNETTATIGNLTAGTTYTVTIHDDCCEATRTFNAECGLSVTAVSSPADNGANGSVTANVTGAQGSVSYLWTSGGTTFGTTSVVGGLNGGTYNVTVTDSGLINCTATTSVLVSSITWKQNTFGCQKELNFGIRKQITGLMAPSRSYYDTATKKAWIASASDYHNGNFYWFNPITATSKSDMNYYPNVKYNSAYDAYWDGQYGKVYSVGTNCAGQSNPCVPDPAYSGLVVYNFTANTSYVIPYGSSVEYDRIQLFVTNQYIYGNVPSLGAHGGVARFNRATLGPTSTPTYITVTGTAMDFIHGGPAPQRSGGWVVNQVKNYLWVGAGSGNIAGDIGILDSNFSYVSRVTLPVKAAYDGAGTYWCNVFYDDVYDLYYANMVNGQMYYVIKPNSTGSAGSVIYSASTKQIRQGRTYAYCQWSIDPVSNKLYASFACGNNTGEAGTTTKKKLFEVDRTTGQFVRMKYSLVLGQIVQVDDGLPDSLMGVDVGKPWWDGHTDSSGGTITIFNNSISGTNTSWLTVYDLEKYVNNTPTGIISANTNTNPYYIPPYTSTTLCPVIYTYPCPSVSQTFETSTGVLYYQFSIADNVKNNPAITKITSSAIKTSIGFTASTDHYPPFVNYYNLSATTTNNTYDIHVEYFTGSSVSVKTCVCFSDCAGG
jgi:hypothetical protein